MDEVKLYRKNVNSIGTWRIFPIYEEGTINIAHATVQGGSEVWHTEEVTRNQSGRSLHEQIDLRIKSRISRMRDKGYKDTVQEAIDNPGNQLGLDRPMLAKQIGKVKNVNFSQGFLQKKLDGHRCLVTLDGAEPLAYSRLGKPIPAIRHILHALKNRLPPGTTLDGELYCHGIKLQTIGSWIKREQADTARLHYVVYDLISEDSYVDRHKELSEIIAGVDTGTPGKVLALPYRPYESAEETNRYFREVRGQGYEGLMLRLNGAGYQPGIRSSHLLKIKEFEDAEFRVVGFSQSKTGWAVCRCVTPAGREFDCSAPGSVSEKQDVWNRRDQFIGRSLTIEFAHWTDDGIPFQPTAIRWREDV